APRPPEPRAARDGVHFQPRGLLALPAGLEGVLRLRPARQLRPLLPVRRPDRPPRQPVPDPGRCARPPPVALPARRGIRDALLHGSPRDPVPHGPSTPDL